ncbi:MAG: LamG-like jellyroll fold domain-containing protein [Sedimentisphaeraceae bacterium JB056]
MKKTSRLKIYFCILLFLLFDYQLVVADPDCYWNFDNHLKEPISGFDLSEPSGVSVSFDDASPLVADYLVLDNSGSTFERVYVSDANDLALGYASSGLPVDRAFTLSVWVKPDTDCNSGEKYIVTKAAMTDGTSSGTFAISMVESQTESGVMYARLRMFGSNCAWSTAFTSDTPLELGEWNLVVARYSGLAYVIESAVVTSGTFNFYSGSWQGFQCNTCISTSAEFTIGGRSDSVSSERFSGAVDELAVWSSCLQSSEVTDVFQKGQMKKTLVDVMASVPVPYDGADNIHSKSFLSWQSGDVATSHDLYMGQNAATVLSADTNSNEYLGNQTTNSYVLSSLSASTTYYWRVDEISNNGIVKGDLWEFTTDEITTSYVAPDYYWAFDEDSTATYGGLDLQESSSGTISYISGLVEECVSIDNSDPNYFGKLYRTGDDSALDLGKNGDSWTISFWFKTDAESGYLLVASKATAGINNRSWWIAAAPSVGQVDVLVRDTDNNSQYQIVNSCPYRADQWNHCVARYIGDLVSISIRSITSDDHKPYSTWLSCNDTYDCSASFMLGGRTDELAANRFTGEIDEFSIYNEALCGDAVNELFLLGKSGLPLTYLTEPQDVTSRASVLYPFDSESLSATDVTLSWGSGTYASSHNVYFGDDYNQVAVADTLSDYYKSNQTSNTYDVGGLKPGTTYYWRIDEVNGGYPQSPWKGEVWSFTTPIETADLSSDTSRRVIVEYDPDQYFGHPSTVMLDDYETIYCTYTLGHGGAVAGITKSTDAGLTWQTRSQVPANCLSYDNCPTLHKLTDSNDVERLFIMAGYGDMVQAYSTDDGATWTNFATNGLECVVVPITIIPIKNGSQHLMVYHTSDWTIWQSVSSDGGLTWTESKPILILPEAQPAEPAIVRSPDGNQILCLIRCCNRGVYNSLMMTTDDEGETWSDPLELPNSLTGDRHMPRYNSYGQLVIAFRDMHSESDTYGKYVAWVGQYDDIISGVQNTQGQYKVCLINNCGSTELNGILWDTGYGGLECLGDNTFVATTYAALAEDEEHSIVSTRFKVDELYEPAAYYWDMDGDGDDSVDNLDLSEPSGVTLSYTSGAESLVGSSVYIDNSDPNVFERLLRTFDDDELDLGSSGDGWTISFWFKTQANSGYHIVASKASAGVNNRSWWIALTGATGKLDLLLRKDDNTSQSQLLTSASSIVGQWNHVVARYNGVSFSISVCPQSSTGHMPDSIWEPFDYDVRDSTANFTIGGRYDEPSTYRYTGYIDEFVVYDDCITDDQVNAIFLLGKSGEPVCD